jgi:hypothetical protein
VTTEPVPKAVIDIHGLDGHFLVPDGPAEAVRVRFMHHGDLASVQLDRPFVGVLHFSLTEGALVVRFIRTPTPEDI